MIMSLCLMNVSDVTVQRVYLWASNDVINAVGQLLNTYVEAFTIHLFNSVMQRYIDFA